MDRWVAMLSMAIDHLQMGAGSFPDLFGNLAMPIYTYHQACSRAGTGERLLGLALLSEIPHWLLFGKAFNIIFLFWLVRGLRDLGQVEKVCTLNFNIQAVLLLVVGMGIFTVNPLLVLWVPLLTTTRREVWYLVHGGMGVLSPEWFVHLVGYEMARNLPMHPSPAKGLWRGFYPAHMLAIGVFKHLR